MKALAFGDLHLRTDRLDDQTWTLTQIAQLAFDRDVDLILLAGDIFHRPRPAPAELHVFRNFLRALEALEIPAVAIHGNLSHDLESADAPSALELFASDWFRVARVPELVRAAGDVAVCCLPSVPVHRLVAAQNGGDRSALYREAADALVEVARGLKAQAPEGWPTVLLAHFAVSGASLPSGLPTDTMGEPVLPLPDLEALGFDAIVLGHIHTGEMLIDVPGQAWAGYTGSPLCLDHGEARMPHGVLLLELGENHGPVVEHVLLEHRRFVTVAVDLTGDAARIEVTTPEDGYDRRVDLDETDFIVAMISEELPLTDAVVRVRYRATEEQHRRVNQQALRGFLDEAGVDRVQILPDLVRVNRVRAEGFDETLGPLDALTAWARANDVDEAPTAALSDVTAGYLEQVTA